MLHERRLDPANSVPASNPLELKLKQSDSAGTSIARGSAVAGQSPRGEVCGTRGSGGADIGELSRPSGPGQASSIARLARSIQQIDHLDAEHTSLSVATNWAYYEVGVAYAAFGQVSARSTPDQLSLTVSPLRHVPVASSQ